jgi:aryl-alcohol dehydrogenase
MIDILAAVARQPGKDFSFEKLKLDEPNDDEILVRIEAVGLCHTDLVFRDMETAVAMPAVLGHEGAGIVEKTGSRIKKVAPGDKVLITYRSCGTCDHCLAHLPAYCRTLPELNFVGQRTDGSKSIRKEDEEVSGNFFGQSSFATHALTYERNVVKVDGNLDSAVYAPLGCGIQTGAGGIMRALSCKPGSSLVVIGAGAVGLSAVMAAVIQQCATIIVIEPLESRRKLASDFGATHTLDPHAGDVAVAIRQIIPQGVDYVFDTSGAVSALEAAFNYLGSHGAIGLVGVPSKANAVLKFPIVQAITLGFSIKGIIEGDSEPDEFIPELIRLHQQNRFPFDRLITTYPFERINDAIQDQHDGKCVKVVLKMP